MGIAFIWLVIVIVFFVLQVMLFFKIWAMTDNVGRIYKLLKNNLEKDTEASSSEQSSVNDDAPLRPNELSISEFVHMKDKEEKGYLNADWSTKVKDYAVYRKNFG